LFLTKWTDCTVVWNFASSCCDLSIKVTPAALVYSHSYCESITKHIKQMVAKIASGLTQQAQQAFPLSSGANYNSIPQKCVLIFKLG